MHIVKGDFTIMKQMSGAERVYIHGVGVDKLTSAQAYVRLCAMLSASPNQPQAIFTPNAEMLYRAANDDAQFASILNTAALNTADGVGTVWASRILGTPLPERIAGIELGETALELAAAKRLPVFLLGGKRGVAYRAAANLRQRYRGLNIVGTHHGYFDVEGKQNQAVIDAIRAAAPKLLIVCLGSPRQERWITQNSRLLSGVSVAMALGGSLDVWAGDVRRAPAAVRAVGMEWLWRILLSPSRLARAKALPAFVIMTIKKSRQRASAPDKSPQ